MNRIERTDTTKSPGGGRRLPGLRADLWKGGHPARVGKPGLTGTELCCGGAAQLHLMAGWNGRNRARMGTAAQGPDRECSGVGVSPCRSTPAEETRGADQVTSQTTIPVGIYWKPGVWDLAHRPISQTWTPTPTHPACSSAGSPRRSSSTPGAHRSSGPSSRPRARSIPPCDREFTTNMPLRNGAEISFDQANSPGGKMLAQGGGKLSGTAAFRLFIKCAEVKNWIVVALKYRHAIASGQRSEHGRLL